MYVTTTERCIVLRQEASCSKIRSCLRRKHSNAIRGRIFVILGRRRPLERIESNILNSPGFGAIDGISPRSFLLLLGLLRDRRLRGGGSSQRSAESEAASLAVDAAEQQTKKRHQRQTKQTPTQHRDCVNGYPQTNGLKRCCR